MKNEQPSVLPIYSSDTSSIINGYRDKKGKIVLEYLANNSRFKITPSVYAEIEIGRDEISDWLQSKRNLIEQELTFQSAGYLEHLLEKYADSFPDNESPGFIYCGLIKTETVRDADPEVIALAKENNYEVLADEKSGIKGACKLEGIPCISMNKLIEKEYHRADKQLPLL